MLDEPATLLVCERDPRREFASQELVLGFEVGHLPRQFLACERRKHGKEWMKTGGHESDRGSKYVEVSGWRFWRTASPDKSSLLA